MSGFIFGIRIFAVNKCLRADDCDLLWTQNHEQQHHRHLLEKYTEWDEEARLGLFLFVAQAVYLLQVSQAYRVPSRMP